MPPGTWDKLIPNPLGDQLYSLLNFAILISDFPRKGQLRSNITTRLGCIRTSHSWSDLPCYQILGAEKQSVHIIGDIVRKYFLVIAVVVVCLLAGCSVFSRKTSVINYPPLDWAINAQRVRETGCADKQQESCRELIALGCDEINGPGFFLGGLQPPYAVMECIHDSGEPPNREYFKQPSGMDVRYRSYVILQDGKYRLIIKKSEFRKIFAPIETTDEALSYAMAMTSLSARNDIDPNAKVDYLVDMIEETHAEETPEGYLVYLFDSDHKMGCDTHSFYAVKVLVTRAGDVHEVTRQEIYRGYACFDFGAMTLDEN
jgi:hypothetical protein